MAGYTFSGKLIIGLMVICIVIVGLFTYNYTQTAYDYQQFEHIKSFHITFQFGRSGEYVLDTERGVLSKYDKAAVFMSETEISPRDMENIYTTMKRIDIAGYPERYEPETAIWNQTAQDFKLSYEIDSLKGSVIWSDAGGSATRKSVALRALFSQIVNIVKGTDAFQELSTES